MASDVNPLRSNAGPPAPRSGPEGSGHIHDQRRGNGRGGGRRRDGEPEEPPEASAPEPEAHIDGDVFAGQRASAVINQLFAEDLPWAEGDAEAPLHGADGNRFLQAIEIPEGPMGDRHRPKPVLGNPKARRVEAHFDAAQAVNQTWVAQRDVLTSAANQTSASGPAAPPPEEEETAISRILKQGPPGRARGPSPLPPPPGESGRAEPPGEDQPGDLPGDALPEGPKDPETRSLAVPAPEVNEADPASASSPPQPPTAATPVRLPPLPAARTRSGPLPQPGARPPGRNASPVPPLPSTPRPAQTSRPAPVPAPAPPTPPQAHRAPAPPSGPAAPSASATQAACVYRVVDLLTDAPLVQARVELEPVKDEMLPTFNGETDADGWFRLAGVPPGEYRVTVRSRGYVPVYRVRTLEAGVVDDLGLFIQKA